MACGIECGVGRHVIAVGHDRHEPAVVALIEQHRPSRRAVGCHRLVHFVDHHAIQQCGRAEDALQFGDRRLKFVAFGFEFDAAHLGESAQAQVENVLRLNIVEVESDHESALGRLRVVA